MLRGGYIMRIYILLEMDRSLRDLQTVIRIILRRRMLVHLPRAMHRVVRYGRIMVHLPRAMHRELIYMRWL